MAMCFVLIIHYDASTIFITYRYLTLARAYHIAD